MDKLNELSNNLQRAILLPIVQLLFALGLLVFVFGIVEYIWGLANESEGKERGKQHMLWGIVGMFIMTAAYSIVKLIGATAIGFLSQ